LRGKNPDEEEYFINWMKEKGCEERYYSKVKALRRLDETGVEAVVEDPLGSGLDIRCLKVSKSEFDKFISY
jgi:hypothetical protein